MGIGQPDFKTPEHIVDAAVTSLKNGEHGYTQGKGMLKLREAVAEDIYNRRKVIIDPENIVIVPGGKVTMWHVILMFGGKGKEIIYPNPGFPIYESVINYSGAKPIPIKTNIREVKVKSTVQGKCACIELVSTLVADPCKISNMLAPVSSLIAL